MTLRGEGYFEVTKSSNRFVVNTDNMKLQVYGTTFNVISRDNLPDEAVLVEGVVILPRKIHQMERKLYFIPVTNHSWIN